MSWKAALTESVNKTEQLTKSVEIQLCFLPSRGSLEMSLKRPLSHQASVPQVGSPQPMSSFHLCNWSVLEVASTCWLYKFHKIANSTWWRPTITIFSHRLQAQKNFKKQLHKELGSCQSSQTIPHLDKKEDRRWPVRVTRTIDGYGSKQSCVDLFPFGSQHSQKHYRSLHHCIPIHTKYKKLNTSLGYF